MESKCIDNYLKKRDAFKVKSDKRKKGKVTAKCSCNSLSEFLQFDISTVKCTLPKKELYKSTIKIDDEPAKTKQTKKAIDKENVKKVKDEITKSSSKDEKKVKNEKPARNSKKCIIEKEKNIKIEVKL